MEQPVSEGEINTEGFSRGSGNHAMPRGLGGEPAEDMALHARKNLVRLLWLRGPW